MKTGNRILDLLFPPHCVFCDQLMALGRESDVCPSCQKSLKRFQSVGKAEFVEKVISPLRYEQEVASSLLRYKFGGKSFYAHVYAQYMTQCLQESDISFDILSWVPLHPKRQWQRGYDQAELLCREVGKNIKHAPISLLRKKRNIAPQSGQHGYSRRKANILNCYALRPNVLVEGRRILLIDDVFTTGATLSECARVLMMAGAEEVYALTLANAHK